jgi:hypothetical protein
METTLIERKTVKKRDVRRACKVKGLSAPEFAHLWKSRSPLDKATADEVARNMAGVKNVEWHS